MGQRRPGTKVTRKINATYILSRPRRRWVRRRLHHVIEQDVPVLRVRRLQCPIGDRHLPRRIVPDIAAVDHAVHGRQIIPWQVETTVGVDSIQQSIPTSADRRGFNGICRFNASMAFAAGVVVPIFIFFIACHLQYAFCTDGTATQTLSRQATEYTATPEVPSLGPWSTSYHRQTCASWLVAWFGRIFPPFPHHFR
jgi:hypothetical protein